MRTARCIVVAMTRDFLRDLHKRILEPLRFPYSMAHAAAILLTLYLVLSGLDWHYFEATRGSIQQFGLSAAIIGFFVPILVPVGLYAVGYLRESPRTRFFATAIAQSEMVAYLISITYKAFTGRMQPEFYTALNTMDNSRDFNFGFLQHGVFWGWPSSHASVALAMVGAVLILFPRHRPLQMLAISYGVFIALGVSVSIHWLSDALAGTIIGLTVGIAIARAHVATSGK